MSLADLPLRHFCTLKEKLYDSHPYVRLYLCVFLSLDRPNVQDHDLVEKLQQPYVDALHSYIRIKRPNVSHDRIEGFQAKNDFCYKIAYKSVHAKSSGYSLFIPVSSCLCLNCIYHSFGEKMLCQTRGSALKNSYINCMVTA